MDTYRETVRSKIFKNENPNLALEWEDSEGYAHKEIIRKKDIIKVYMVIDGENTLVIDTVLPSSVYKMHTIEINGSSHFIYHLYAKLTNWLNCDHFKAY